MVEPGVAYRFDKRHFCLSFLTDFDGSFWRPANPNDGEPPSLFYNQDVGPWRSSGRTSHVPELGWLGWPGGRLVRIDGSVLETGLCA